MHVMKLFSLENKVALVTGGRGLYGSAISEGLCEAGAKVVIASRNGAKCEEYADSLRQKGFEACGLTLDLGSDQSIDQLVEDIIARFGRIDILVNNAVDRNSMVSLADATREKLQFSAGVNLNGQILLSQRCLEHFVRQKKGNIINISSMRGLDCPHFPFYPPEYGDQPVNYTTEKWAMVGLTKYMAGRYGKDGVRANCICPGGYNGENPSARVADDAPFTKAYKENCPLGDWAHYDDIKGPVVFLASEASAYVTGATLVMDGGWTIW